jgi:tRNA U34 5-carboxymethylaminomethyl modifying GTPase MnmE/TrmE
VLNSRQAESLQRCLGWLTQASDSFDEIMQVEFLKAAMLELKTLKGEIFNIDKIYDRIFSTFCVGK